MYLPFLMLRNMGGKSAQDGSSLSLLENQIASLNYWFSSLLDQYTQPRINWLQMQTPLCIPGGSLPNSQDFGGCCHPGMEAEAVVSHHLIKTIITGSGTGAKKRKKAFQSLPLHFNRSPMLYNTGEQGVNQLKNIVLHSMHCGLQLPNDLHLSSLAVEVYNWTKESLE